MEDLHQEANRAEAKSQRLAREVARATESAKTACRTLRLALTDMGAKARGVPGENASALEFCKWTQQAGCAVSDCATAYGAPMADKSFEEDK
uniref:Pectinesterase inhibitor domain-containing protein n=1 Tax=Oryza punctata TaxID=4537 RepID=A0A0E0LBK6_ORYPU